MAYPKAQQCKSGHCKTSNMMARAVATRSVDGATNVVNLAVVKVVEDLFAFNRLPGTGAFMRSIFLALFEVNKFLMASDNLR